MNDTNVYRIETNLTENEAIELIKENTLIINSNPFFFNINVDDTYLFYGDVIENSFKIHTTKRSSSHLYMSIVGNISGDFGKSVVRFEIKRNYFPTNILKMLGSVFTVLSFGIALRDYFRTEYCIAICIFLILLPIYMMFIYTNIDMKKG